MAKSLHLFGDENHAISKKEKAELQARIARGEMIVHKHFVTIEELDEERARIQKNRENAKSTCSTREELEVKFAESKKRILNG